MKNESTSAKFVFILYLSIFVFHAEVFGVKAACLSAKTLEKSTVFIIPEIRAVRIESNKTIDVHFLDSCNLEKKFRLYRKKNDGVWTIIDSMSNCSPDSMVWRLFHNKLRDGGLKINYV